MPTGSETEEKTPEVSTTIRTRRMFNVVMLIESVLLFPRFVIGLFK